MNLNRAPFLCVASIMLISASSQAVIEYNRCRTTRDVITDATLAEGRRAWAMRCFPSFRGLIKSNNQLTDSDTKQSFPGYPTFGVMADGSDTPTNPLNWFAPTRADEPCSYPADYILVGFCAMSGCYTPEQQVLFEDGYHAIGVAKNSDLKDIRTLSDTSAVDFLEFITKPVDYFITDLVEGKQTILNFQMASGGTLRVTENHPIVDGIGRMRSAESLKVGELLVRTDGTRDPIMSIVSEEYFGRVYNVEVKSEKLMEKIIAAQGYLNGSLYFQNEGTRDLNRVLFRTSQISDQMVR